MAFDPLHKLQWEFLVFFSSFFCYVRGSVWQRGIRVIEEGVIKIPDRRSCQNYSSNVSGKRKVRYENVDDLLGDNLDERKLVKVIIITISIRVFVNPAIIQQDLCINQKISYENSNNHLCYLYLQYLQYWDTLLYLFCLRNSCGD